MTHDPTEGARRLMVAAINYDPSSREGLEAQHGKGNVWDTQELQQDFTVLAFAAPFCVVERKADGVKGSVMFQHSPRFYFGFKADNEGR